MVNVGYGSQPHAWCQRQELNLRPKAYESSALPLSYSGDLENERNRSSCTSLKSLAEPVKALRTAKQ